MIMSSSISSSVPQPRAHVLSVLLSSLLVAEKEPTREWLRAGINRAVDPMLHSIFQRLINKLRNAGWDREEHAADLAQMNRSDHVESNNHQTRSPATYIPKPSTYNRSRHAGALVEDPLDHETLHVRMHRAILEYEASNQLQNEQVTEDSEGGDEESQFVANERIETTHQVNHTIEPDIKEEFDDDQTTSDNQQLNPFDQSSNPESNQTSSHNAQPSTSTYCQDSIPQHSKSKSGLYKSKFDPEILAQIEREIKEEQKEMMLKNLMDNVQIEDCDEYEDEEEEGDDMRHQAGHIALSDSSSPSLDDHHLFSSSNCDGQMSNQKIDDDQQPNGQVINDITAHWTRHMVDLDESLTVETPRIVTTRSLHPNEQTVEIIKQTEGHLKRKQQNEANSQETKKEKDNGEKDEDKDERQQEVTSRSVKRPRPSSPTTLSSTKPNTQIITHTLQCPQAGCGDMIDKDKFRKHMEEEHSTGPFRCAVKDCGESFHNTTVLGLHIDQSHQSTSQWHCDKCDKHSTSYNRLSVHKYQYHQLGHFQCSFPACTFTGEYRSKVYSHYPTQHKPTVKCPYPGCQYETLKSTNLKKHQLVHLRIKPYKCKWNGCDFAATDRSSTIAHICAKHFKGNQNSSVRLGDYVEVNDEMLLNNHDGHEHTNGDAKSCDNQINSQSLHKTHILGHHLTQSHQSTSQWNCDNHFSPYPPLSNINNHHHHPLNKAHNSNLYFAKSNEQSSHNLTNWKNGQYQMNSNNQQQANSYNHLKSITLLHQPLTSFTSSYNSNSYKSPTFNPHSYRPSTLISQQTTFNPHFHQQHSISYEMALQNMMHNTSRNNQQIEVEFDEDAGEEEDNSIQVGHITHYVQSDQVKNGDIEREEKDDDEEVISTHSSGQIITHALQCPQCDRMFNKNKFNNHLMEEHSIDLFRCMLKNCAQSFPNQLSLSHHLAQSHQFTAQWHCGKCDYHFTSYNGLSHHNYQLHQLGHFECSFPACTFTGEYKSKVFNHYTTKHKQKVMRKCPHFGCQYETSDVTSLKRHRRIHLNLKPYRCKWPQCDYASAQQSNTIAHIHRMHFPPNPVLHSCLPLGDARDYVEVVHEL